MTDYRSDADPVQAAANFLSGKIQRVPPLAIILGSGLGSLAQQLRGPFSIPYGDIPGWGQTTAAGHAGALVVGSLADRPVIALAGRLHRYEGWSRSEVTFPVRVLAALSVKTLIVSNAAGGVNPKFKVGDIVVIRDHIDWLHGHQVGSARQATGTLQRHAIPYDDQLCEIALLAARRADFVAHQGTYLATLGPSYETRAEYRMMRRVGADVVGMSTVPEVLQAQQHQMRVLALSVVSNVAQPDLAVSTDHQEVLDAGVLAQPRMLAIVQDAVRSGLAT